MDTHSGDTPANRFLSFWGALLTFLVFGAAILLFVAFESVLVPSSSEDPDDQRRTELDTATLAEQKKLANTWARNDDGTYQVPVTFALPTMTDKFSGPTRSEVPVPGTKAAEEAAAAAAVQPAPQEEAGAAQTSENP